MVVRCGVDWAVGHRGSGPSPADAHTTEDPYLYLFVTETELDGRVELSVADLEVVLDRKFASDDPTIKVELDAAADQIRRYAADHVSIGLTDSADAQWPISFGDVELFVNAMIWRSPSSPMWFQCQAICRSCPLTWR